MKKFSLRLLYAAAIFLVAGFPILLLCLQWGSALLAVFFPETTCWLGGVEGKFILPTEIPLGLFRVFLPFWLPFAVAVAGLFYIFSKQGKDRRLVVWTMCAAILSSVLIFLSSSFAVDLELSAFRAYRENC